MDQSQLYSLYDRDPGPIVRFLGYLRDLYRLPDAAAVLDMGCGPGRLIAPLNEAGWTVTGYEPDADYAVAAKERVREIGRGRVREGGFLDLDEVRSFDLIAAVNGPYSYLLDLTSRRTAIQRCARALRPGGVLFLEVANFPWILRNYQEPPTLDLQVGRTKVGRTARHEIDFHLGTFTHHDRFTWTDEAGQAHEVAKVHRMAMVSLPEIDFFLREAGFDEISTFNDFADRAPSQVSGKRILVAAQIQSRAS